MKAFDLLSPRPVFVEIGQSSLKMLDGNEGFEFPLDRLQNGRLSSSCKESLRSALQNFLKRKSWSQRRRAWCAIGSRGVSLRRLTLPASSKDELQRLLTLQVEAEFPLAPDELAWGYREIPPEGRPLSQPTANQELIVVAVKREIVEEYSEILLSCGLNPKFTLGALVRSSVCQQPPRSFAMLDIGWNHSELAVFENGLPTTIRLVPWGGESLTRSIVERIGIDRDAAEKLKVELANNATLEAEPGPAVEHALRSALDSLAAIFPANSHGTKIYLSGRTARLPKLAASLATAFEEKVECETIQIPPGQGGSAAILGFKNSFQKNGTSAPLIIQLNPVKRVPTATHAAHWKWAAAAGLLALASFSLRYAEAFIQKPRLAKQLAEIRTYKQGFPGIERELSFLQHLQTNQPPYLEAALAIANAAAPGTRIESLSMNRRGDLSLRGVLQNPQQAIDFRSKLSDSGFFSSVVLEEQSPAPDRQRVTVRMSAQWKPTGDRPPITAASSSSKNLKNGTAGAVAKTDAVAVANAELTKGKAEDSK
ncbi:MAG: pilus assembly protein PilM [Verrucomicrobiales bacterium]|nr:pilus assembly protein PilM [Verrucomicrobiales bacterium]